jgi:hypothetical protein
MLVGTLAMAIPGVASAGSYTFATASGAKESGGNPVSASVDFTTSANTITVAITNLFVDPKTIAQNISDLFFDVSKGSVSTGSITSSAGLSRDVASNGSYTDGSVVATGWLYSGSGSTIHLDGLNGAGFTPAHTIIGSPNGSNIYGNANNSITGNGPHNPFLAGTVTFTLNVTGMTADTSISNVIFSFGTASGDNVPGTPGTAIPEPASMTLVAIGIASLASVAAARRRLTRSPAA